MGQTITSGDLVKKLGGELIGDSNILINSVASLESAHQNSISFFPKNQPIELRNALEDKHRNSLSLAT